MQEFLVSPQESGQRFDKYLHRRLPLAPSSFLYKMLRKKNITLRGKKADGSEKVEAGDRVVLFLSDETIGKFSAKRDDQALSKETEEIRKAYRTLQPLLGDSPVLYEDDNILIVRKPAGILSQKAAAQDISMNEWLRGYLLERQGDRGRQEQQEKEREIFRPSVCNRLDRNTGGILLCACSLQGSRALSAVIRGRALRKTYRMVVHGRVEEPGMIDTDLIKDHSTNQVRTAVKPADTAEKQKQGLRDKESLRSAVTVYRPVHAGRKCTMVEADLITGRSHQLRVHMASIGHPIVFDPRYGDRKLDLSLAQTIPVKQTVTAKQTVPSKQTASAKQTVSAKQAVLKGGRGKGSPQRAGGQLLWCTQIAFPRAEESDLMQDVLRPLAGHVIRCPAPKWWNTLCE